MIKYQVNQTVRCDTLFAHFYILYVKERVALKDLRDSVSSLKKKLAKMIVDSAELSVEHR